MKLLTFFPRKKKIWAAGPLKQLIIQFLELKHTRLISKAIKKIFFLLKVQVDKALFNV